MSEDEHIYKKIIDQLKQHGISDRAIQRILKWYWNDDDASLPSPNGSRQV